MLPLEVERYWHFYWVRWGWEQHEPDTAMELAYYHAVLRYWPPV